MIIVIDAGHGGRDSGASHLERIEKNDNLKMALSIGHLLKNFADVRLVRGDDKFVSISDRVKFATENNADLVISLHRNAHNSDAHGYESLIFDNDKKLLELNSNIRKRIERYFRYRNQKSRKDLGLLRGLPNKAIILEVGFISSKTDNETFEKNYEEIVKQIAEAVKETYKLGSTSFSKDFDDYKEAQKFGRQCICNTED